jgi:hypothetical protein
MNARRSLAGRIALVVGVVCVAAGVPCVALADAAPSIAPTVAATLPPLVLADAGPSIPSDVAGPLLAGLVLFVLIGLAIVIGVIALVAWLLLRRSARARQAEAEAEAPDTAAPAPPQEPPAEQG